MAAVPVGVTIAGEKAKEAPDGSPVHAKEIGALNPFIGVTVTVAAPGVVAVAVTEAGLTPTANPAEC